MKQVDGINPGYIAYIDEAGDPGLRRVRPIDPIGGTEWMILSAVLIRAENEANILSWHKELVEDLNIRQRKDIHFRDLSYPKKDKVCLALSGYPARIFVVASNKKNMRQYRNHRAEKIPSNQWFYNWLVRILVERITHYVERHSVKNFGKPRHVTFEFSERGGHSYDQTAAYHALLAQQAKGSGPLLDKWVPKWNVMDWRLVKAYPHKTRVGLQFADIVASAFFAAVDNLDSGPCEVRFAKALRPRVASLDNRHADYGLVLQPTPPTRGRLTNDQQEIFRYYGYQF